MALAHLRLMTVSATSHDQVRSELADAARVFEELGDEAGLARALGLAGQLRFWAGGAESAIEDLERAARHAHNAGDRLQESQSLGYVLIAMANGPTPVAAVKQRAEQMRDQAQGDRRLQVTILRWQARLESLQGDFDAARRLIAEARSLADELGLEVSAIGVQAEAGRIELSAGHPAAAERSLRPAVEMLERMGNQGHFVTDAPLLVDALFAQGRGEEAAGLIDRVEEWAIADDVDPQIGWRRVKAKLLAQRGELERAEQLAREAVELAGRTDFVIDHGRALEDLAEVLRLAGRPEEAPVELAHAVRLYREKGDLDSAVKAEARLDELRRSLSPSL
jgi:tetratricopeptide (TPR) repeat protein